MKKFMSILLATGLSVAGLVGCSSNDGGEQNSTPSDQTPSTDQTTGEKTTVKLWLDYDEYAEALEEAIEAKFPQYDIVWEHVESVDTRTKLELDGPAGVGPDIFTQPHDNILNRFKTKILFH